jgi:hypothetical protein
MDAATRAALLDRYREGPAAVRAALADADPSTLDAAPAAGEWSARQVVHHLADSETMSTIRLRRLLAEDEPLVAAYDENEWAHRLHYDRPLERSLALFDAVRASNAELLASLGEDEWARTGTHSEDGAYGVERWLEIYAEHGHDHAAQIREALRSA